MGFAQLDSQTLTERLKLGVGDRIVRWAKVEAMEGGRGYFAAIA